MDSLRPLATPLSRRLWLSTATAAWAAMALPARAQRRGSRLIVPFAPGGGNDVFARQMAHGLNEGFGYGMIVENKAGAGGNLGTEAVVRAAGDGGTWLLGHTGTVSINPSLYPGLSSMRPPTCSPWPCSPRRPCCWWCRPPHPRAAWPTWPSRCASAAAR
jgi:hypothetical protein